MRVALIGSPFANLGSVSRALAVAGAELEVTSEPDAIASASKIVLPGVGTFGASMEWLDSTGIASAIVAAVARGAMLLGICVGHQLLFDDSDEVSPRRGLGLIRGSVRRFPAGLPVPQVGWNRVDTTADPLFAGIDERTPFYFVNSYRATAVAAESVTGYAEYGARFIAAVREKNVAGVQFHPEKSSGAGLRLLANFVRLT